MHNVDYWKFFKSGNPYDITSIHDGLQADKSTGFVAFDQYKSLLADAEGNVSGPANVIAGFGAGATESLLAVTPFESIKTQLSVNQRYWIEIED